MTVPPDPFAQGRGVPPPGPPPPPGYGFATPPTQRPPGIYVHPESGLTLPGGVAIAGVGRRIGAFFLGLLLSILTLGIGYVIWGLIVWGRGQTQTYQVLGMRCWRPETNRVAGFWWMALREIVGRFVDGILSIVTLVLSFVLMVSSPKRQCLHDLIAGTVVVHDPNKVMASQPGPSV
jgi:uncharacterized RDD family membrane protein YckC